MSIAIKFGKETFDFRLEDIKAISDIQASLEELTGVIARKQKLVFKGKILDPEASLAKYGIKEGSKIMMLSSQVALPKVQSLILIYKVCSFKGKTIEQKSPEERLSIAKEKVKQRLAARNTTSSGFSREDQLKNWRKMKIIACQDSGLEGFPMYVLEISDVAEFANFSSNLLSAIPKEIQSFQKLRVLDLSKNVLTIDGIDKALFMLEGLRKLLLDDNELTGVPKEIGDLINLESLSLKNNRIQSIPDVFSALQDLSDLNFSQNIVTILPISLGSCKRLKFLSIAENKIAELPDSLSKLKELKILNADDNRINTVPSEILRGCDSLMMLSLHGNPLTMTQMRELDGFEEYEKRRREQYDKKLDISAMQPGERFDEGADQE